MNWTRIRMSTSAAIFMMSVNSCWIEPCHLEESGVNSRHYISSESVICTGVSHTRVPKDSHIDPYTIDDDGFEAVLSVRYSDAESACTKSSLVDDMYSEFAFGVDDFSKLTGVTRCGIDNEKMTITESGAYRSSHVYSITYSCHDFSDVVCLWGYAPYRDTCLTYLEDGERFIDVSVENPLSQGDILVMKNVTDRSQICLSPVESTLRFQHVLTAVNFHYYGSSGISGVIDSLRITGINRSGKYNVYDNDWAPEGKVYDWHCCSGVEFTPEDNGKCILGEGESLLFVPQIFSPDAYIEIDYSLRIGSSCSVRRGTLKAPLAALGDWEPGTAVDYILSFTGKLQPRIESSSPDTLSWNWNDGPEAIQTMYIVGENLDASTSSPELYGEESGHWKIKSVDFKDNGRSAEVSLYPVCTNIDGRKDAKLRFHYPEVSGFGAAEAILCHNSLNTELQVFAAMKNKNYDAGSSLADGFVAVRPDRDGTVYMYMNEAGKWGADNSLGIPGGTGYQDWTADFDELESGYGITCEYDNLTHRLSFTVSDKTVFESHILEVPRLNCMLNTGKRLSINVKLMPDFFIEGFDDFYVGMKRYPSPSGFCGNLSMKTTSASGSLRYGEERYSLSCESVPLQALYSYKGGNSNLVIVSDDEFNDSVYSADIEILDPSPSISLDDGYLYIHGDEVTLSVHYNDKYGNAIPALKFDKKSYDELLMCSVDFRQYQGLPFLGADHYEVCETDGKFLCYVSSIPDDYQPHIDYPVEIVACAAYDKSVRSSVTASVPAFDNNYVTGTIARIDDYLSLNPEEGISVCSDHTFTYGVKSVDDLQCEVCPCSSSSYENDCITADISDKENGRFTFILKDTDLDDELVTHSVGRHAVIVSTSNKHSGEKIYRTDLNPALNVYVHAAVGAGVYLTDYDEDNGLTAVFFGETLSDICKCSLEDIEGGHDFVRPVASEYSGSQTIYKWKSLAIRADIDADKTGTFMGEDNPYLTIRFSLNRTGSSEYEIENAINIINGVWDDSTGKSFFGYGGLYGTTPEMKFYNGSKVSVENIRHSDLVDDDGLGFYYVHTMESLDNDSGGWLNIMYGLGMPHYGCTNPCREASAELTMS